MAIQKKSLIGKRQSVKKALVAKRVSADTPKGAQVKAPNLIIGHQHNAPFVAHQSKAPFVAHQSKAPFVAHQSKAPFQVRSTFRAKV
jgi:hypothetical protein